MPSPIIVACTAHSDDKYIKKAWDHKMDMFIEKPLKDNVVDLVLAKFVKSN